MKRLTFDNVVDANAYLYHHGKIVAADMPADVYHNTNAISHSAIKVMGESASKYKWALDHKRKETPALAMGTAIHMAVLEPDRFESTYRVQPKFDRRTKAGKAEAEAWDAENADKTGVSQDEMNTIMRVHSKIYECEKFSGLVKTGIKESSFFSRWDDSKLYVRCRPDNFIEDKSIIVDLKTTDAAQEHVFKHDITKYSYMTQAAWYCHIVSLATGVDVDTFVILAVEKSKDCDVNAFYFSRDTLDFFLNRYCRKWMTDLERCIATDTWPGYEREFIEYTPPAWMTEKF
jgi:hypothetical protein